ncbi:MAG: ribosome rescue protein RqcH [Candidatus Helarchaeota archaeon]
MMSNFDIHAIVSELNDELLGAWIQQIYVLEENIILLKLRTVTKKACQLLIQPGIRIHLTNYERPKPRFPPNFCVSLRKRLKNLRIKKISQYNLDRIVVFEIGRILPPGADSEQPVPDNYKLICEFFRDGNVVLTNSSRNVITALFYKTMRDRRIIPNREFNFIPSKGENFLSLELEDLKRYLEGSERPIISTLLSNINLSPRYAEELCFLSKIEKDKKASELTDQEISILFEKIEELQAKLLNKQYEPVTVLKNGEVHSVSPFKLHHEEAIGLQFVRKFDTYNETVDEFYSKKEINVLEKTIQQEAKTKGTKLSKLEKVLKEQQKKMDEFNKTAELNKKHGDLIYAHFTPLQELLETITEARKKKMSWDQIIENIEKAKQQGIPAALIVEKISPKTASVAIRLDDTVLSIDFRKKPTDIANDFYLKSKKAANKIKGALIAIQNTTEKIKLAQQEVQEPEPIQIEKGLKKKRKRKWYEAYHWFYSSDGFLVLAGRDLKSNEILVRKHMDSSDIFIHATFRGAAVGIIKTNNEPVSNETIQEAVQFTVSFSSAWKSNFSVADGYWVKGEQVSFSPPSGEYLAKGSFIVKGTKNAMKNNPLKLRLGIRIQEDEPTPIVEPTLKPEMDLLFPAEIIPGDKKSGALCKLIKNKWMDIARTSDQSEDLVTLIKKIPLDEIQRLIPAGKGDILVHKKKKMKPS